MVIMSGGPITVLLADDNLIVREGVRALLGIEATASFSVNALTLELDFDLLLIGLGART